MEPIHIHQIIRPVRYAFVIDDGDLSGAHRAVALNASLWGGMYNPLVPLDTEQRWDGLITAFDPDTIVDLSTEGVPRDLRERFEDRLIQQEQLVRADWRTGEHVLALGFSVIPVLHHVYNTEVRFSTGPSRAALVDAADPADWGSYVAFSFGSFDQLPETRHDYRDLFLQALRAREVTFHQGEDVDAFRSLLSPIDMTGYGIQLYGGRANFSSHIVFIGDHTSFADLVEFWNIRATGRTAWFVPVAAYEPHEAMIREIVRAGRYPINPNVENHADLQRGPSVPEERFTTISDWVTERDITGFARRTWQPRYGRVIPGYVGDIHVADLEAKSGDEMSLLDDGRMTPIKTLAPPFLEDTASVGDQRWALEVSMRGGYGQAEWMFSFPRSKSVENLVGRALSARTGRVRLGRRGIVKIQDTVTDSIYVQPIKTRDAFYALFQDAGLQASPSLPGRYADQIIDKMGSLIYDCRVFKIRGVREVLQQLSSGQKLTQGNMRGTILSRAARDHGPYWQDDLYRGLYVKSGQAEQTPAFEDIFDVLLQRRALRPGYTLRCEECYTGDWYHISEFNESYVCRYCFSEQQVPFGSRAQGRGWEYAADGVFRIPCGAMGSLAVIVSLWRLALPRTSGESRYLTSTLLRAEGGFEYEIDFAFIDMHMFHTEYELVLGEARSYSDFTEREVTRARELADRFERRPFLAFSTLKEEFADSEKELLRSLVESDYKVIVLTRRELDPYALHDRFQDAPHAHAVNLTDLAENTVALNL